MRNIAPRVTSKTTGSDELAVPIIAAKKTSEMKPAHHTKPGPDYPWHRPVKLHIDRGVIFSLNDNTP